MNDDSLLNASGVGTHVADGSEGQAQVLTPDTQKNIPFMNYRMPTAILSILLVLVSIASLFHKQLTLGLDFTGGVLVEIAYDQAADLVQIRQQLQQAGFDDAVVQHYGRESEVLVRLPPQQAISGRDKPSPAADSEAGAEAEPGIGDRIMATLQTSKEDQLVLKRIEVVGPQIGDELRDQSGVAMLFALGCMLLYVTFRFKFKFAIGAVAALFHDVLITLGIFSLFEIQFDLTVLAAILAVIGYSLNDTIVVSDRIRENFRLFHQGEPADIVNQSLTQTLTRTLVTSLTTLLVLLALLIFGGELIRGFAIALIVGVVIGTYSSVYVASNVVLAMKVAREDFLEPELDEIDDRP